MNKYFISINETEKGLYEFIIEFINEEYMDEKSTLGVKSDIDSLDECYEMIKDFPSSATSGLELIQFNRYHKQLRPTVFELEFKESIEKFLLSNNKAKEVYKFN